MSARLRRAGRCGGCAALARSAANARAFAPLRALRVRIPAFASKRPGTTRAPGVQVAWRRERDSNPRDARAPNGFQDRRIQPLCHLSVTGNDSIVQKDLRRKGEYGYARAGRALHARGACRGAGRRRAGRGAHRRRRGCTKARSLRAHTQPARAGRRSFRARGISGDARGCSLARSLAAYRLHGVRDARAVPHVRGPYGERARGSLRIWCGRPQGGRDRARSFM